MNYYPHHIGDYLRDTVHLSALEDGLYRRMLDLYYASEKPLPLDFDWLCKLIRVHTHEEKTQAHGVLHQFFRKHPDGWRNKRADIEIVANARRVKAARRNGKKGGRPITQRVATGLAKPNPTNNPGLNSQNQNQNQNQNQITTEEVAVLPSWLPLEPWKAWLEVRRKVKAPNTPRALNLALQELTRLKSQGFDPRAVIDQSVLRGWKAFYPLKEGLPAAEPVGKLCDYCEAVSSGTVNGRRACDKHWDRAMGNESPIKRAFQVIEDKKLASAGRD